MPINVTHAFVNPKSDSADTTIVRPSNWNAGHIVTGAAEAPALSTDNAVARYDGVAGALQDSAVLIEDSATELMRVEANGSVNVGRAGPGDVTNFFVPIRYEVASSSSFWNTRFHSFGNDSTPTSNIFSRSRGVTPGAFTALVNNDGMGQNIYYGADGANFIQSAVILASVDGPVAPGDVPSRITFWTAEVGFGFAQERVRIDNKGLLSCAGPIKTLSALVGALPPATIAGPGARAFVTDATTKVFNDPVVGGGSFKVPVVSDGTNWLIG